MREDINAPPCFPVAPVTRIDRFNAMVSTLEVRGSRFDR